MGSNYPQITDNHCDHQMTLQQAMAPILINQTYNPLPYLYLRLLSIYSQCQTDSSQPNRLSSAPDPEKGLNVLQYRELNKVKTPIDYPVSNKPPPPQPLLAPLPATKNVKTTVPVQATAAGDGEKLPHSLIAFNDLNQFWTSSSNTDQESFNNQSLHSFTDPQRLEPI
ncbi:hypothetical protein PPACK8108_LOCUS21175 [Phakopsora pachyrhizi]|uniref:Uncharacterized protein n=1 Tax=Phakopsora pachyrhizi TaxID=170000 RepID=A0AAV0BH24_PHAPC|nr:hypothetical protein PPACK8108_LOCUS21175 [Phakopsora pachyrhizi]